jgi:hypothetical protein
MGGDQRIDLAYGLGVEALPNATTHRHARYVLPPCLSPVATKQLTAARDAGNLSSNGGAVVLREVVRRLGIAKTIAGPLPDTRNPLLVTHSYADMVAARIMAIACGHEDADDLDTLRHYPALKIAIDRAPESGAGLPSQPTISRLENLAYVRALYRIGLGMIDLDARVGYRMSVCSSGAASV